MLNVSLSLGQVLLGMCKHRLQPFKISKIIIVLAKFSCFKKEWLQFKICILSISLLKTVIRYFILGARRLGLLIIFLPNPHVSKSEFRHIYCEYKLIFLDKSIADPSGTNHPDILLCSLDLTFVLQLNKHVPEIQPRVCKQLRTLLVWIITWLIT